MEKALLRLHTSCLMECDLMTEFWLKSEGEKSGLDSPSLEVLVGLKVLDTSKGEGWTVLD